MPDDIDGTSGRAALGLLEALLTILVEKKVLSQDEVDEVFSTAIDAFRAASQEEDNGHIAAVARVLTRVQVDGNGVRLR